MLPWMPRRRLPAWLPAEGLDFADGGDSGIVTLVIVGIVLLPITILLAVFLFEWILVLLLLPLAAFASTFVGRPWLIVARQGSGFPQQYLTRSQRRRYARHVRGWRESRRTIRQVRLDIAEAGAPRSLGEPGPLRPARRLKVRDAQPLDQ
jgi:hypothetical protein